MGPNPVLNFAGKSTCFRPSKKRLCLSETRASDKALSFLTLQEIPIKIHNKLEVDALVNCYVNHDRGTPRQKYPLQLRLKCILKDTDRRNKEKLFCKDQGNYIPISTFHYVAPQ